MKQTLIFLKYNLNRLIIRNPISFILSIMAPVIVAVIMLNISNSSFDSRISIGVLDKDSSSASQYVIDTLNTNENLKVTSYNEYKEESIIKKKEKLFIEIEEGFGKNPSINNMIKLHYFEGNNEIDGICYGISSEINNLINLRGKSNGIDSDYEKLIANQYESNLNIIKDSEIDKTGQYIGVQVMIAQIIFLMFIKGGSASEIFFRDKEINIFTRLFTMPIKTWHYHLAALVSNMIALIIQSFTTIIIARFVINVNFNMPIWRVFLLMFIFTTVIVAFSQLITSISRTPQQVGSINMNILMIWSIIGGAFMPVAYFPEVLDRVSYLSPIRWAVKYVADVQTTSGAFRGLEALVIILLFATVMFLGAIYMSNKKEKVYV